LNLETFYIDNEVSAIKSCIKEASELLQSLQKNYQLSEKGESYLETKEQIFSLAEMLGEVKDVEYSLETAKSIMLQLINKHEAYYELLPTLKNKEDDHEF
jgi:hypothetical protein